MKMNIRIDDRLIHGQVAAIWCNKLKTTRIIVANDAVAADDLRKMALKMAAPAGVKVSVISTEKAATNMKAGKYDADKVLLIMPNPKDALNLMDMGIKMEVVNVGNMGHKDDTIQIKKSINVTKEDAANFRKLAELGVKLTAIMVPDEDENNLLDFLGEAGL